ncbi:hypothetical protein GE118_03610 [Mycoplasma sp. NEAQ87857]|uniref:MSC_0882 family membrane protein n=1 Tax=Mycoplasma sp. NEAQ87857 TaxID=2683967 RepID=UPI0013173311|nr:hypothetical protein [Mycoplasma sp. NEAQ87857]QGZ97238.1 hypothetical protein GE118_00270 [Mycoplasma sp. NEAQ87857]QGZ97869.1 hypothetical protein GE118_03610 [Mycoplasma sp. NEAQ87857]
MQLINKIFKAKNSPPIINTTSNTNTISPIINQNTEQVNTNLSNLKIIYDASDKEWLFSTVKFELKYNLLIWILNLICFITNSIFIGLFFSKVLNYDFSSSIAIFLSILNIVLLATFLKSLLTYIRFKKLYKILSKYKEDNSILESKTSYFFRDYLKLNKTILHLIWINVFIITFYGLFSLIVFGLRNQVWVLGSLDRDFYWKIDWASKLANAFGDVNTFSIINLTSLSVLLVFTIIYIIFANYRLNNIFVVFKNDAINIQSIWLESKKTINRYYFIAYILSLVFIVFLPIIMILYFVLRKFLWRKK